MTVRRSQEVRGGGIKQKGKRAHGHGQQFGFLEGHIRGGEVLEKNTVKFFFN